MNGRHRLPRPSAALPLLLAASCASAPPPEERQFDVVQRFEVEVPAGAQRVQAWFALPDDRDELQTVSSLDHALEAPPAVRVETREVRDRLGNRFLFLEAENAAGSKLAVQSSFRLARRGIEVHAEPSDTRPLTPAERERMAPYLAESAHVVATPQIRARAAEVVGDEQNPLVQARLLYDWVLDHVQYWVKDPERWKASATGSSAYCYESGTGNCTDFHSLYSAAASAVGLPNRIVYGSFLKAPLDGQDTDQSYHCWIEF